MSKANWILEIQNVLVLFKSSGIFEIRGVIIENIKDLFFPAVYFSLTWKRGAYGRGDLGLSGIVGFHFPAGFQPNHGKIKK